jgi:hypothetical protein
VATVRNLLVKLGFSSSRMLYYGISVLSIIAIVASFPSIKVSVVHAGCNPHCSVTESCPNPEVGQVAQSLCASCALLSCYACTYDTCTSIEAQCIAQNDGKGDYCILCAVGNETGKKQCC